MVMFWNKVAAERPHEEERQESECAIQASQESMPLERHQHVHFTLPPGLLPASGGSLMESAQLQVARASGSVQLDRSLD